MNAPISRRAWLQATGTLAGAAMLGRAGVAQESPNRFRLATFRADVTVPIGHPLMGGGVPPAAIVDDPLEVHGLVLGGVGEPIVVASVDWCEIRNDAYDAWRSALASAVDTHPGRVLVSSGHQHDAPVADLAAERILEQNQTVGRICHIDFHQETVARVAKVAGKAWQGARPVTHYGTGQARVEGVASNRRWRKPDGTLAFSRMSRTTDAEARAAEDGTIDPFLKTLSFWNGDEPLAALHAYAVHPMSRYGEGRVSADFIGLARRLRQADQKGTHQIYFSGCSGNVTAGKYNDGAPADRAILADRLNRAMAAAWEATSRRPLESLEFRSAPLRLEPRDTPGFTRDDLHARLKNHDRPFEQCLAALGLSWRERADAGYRLDVPAVDLGDAQLLLLPAESYVEYQLFAQQTRPDSFVFTAGYGECAPGYIPIEERWREKDTNLGDWCWVAEGAEPAMQAAIRQSLGVV
ncbi:MAG: hypothetical protein KF708_01130 [Pirellulales bacterium]|nr:hypothetical protein [Pirellulales bacterium]